MEVYDDPSYNLPFPQPFDMSLSLKGFVELFSAKSKSNDISIANSYTFSYGNSYLCIFPTVNSLYRVIGRLFRVAKKVVKHCSDYDVYFVGSLSDCRSYWVDCVRDEIMQNYII